MARCMVGHSVLQTNVSEADSASATHLIEQLADVRLGLRDLVVVDVAAARQSARDLTRKVRAVWERHRVAVHLQYPLRSCRLVRRSTVDGRESGNRPAFSRPTP